MSGSDQHNGDWSTVVVWREYREIAKAIWFPAEQGIVKNVPAKGLVDNKVLCKALDLRGGEGLSKEALEINFPPGSSVRVENADGSWTQRAEP